jgi:hypothetical protein
MTNHYHLLMETPDANLANGMRQLNGVYTLRLKRGSQTLRARLPGPVQGDHRAEGNISQGIGALHRAEPGSSKDGRACRPAQRSPLAKPLTEYAALY